MTLAFSLEDLDVDITNNDEDSDMDIAIGQGEATVEITNMINLGNRIVEIVANLGVMADHFTKFGITKESLHLMNGKNKLGRAIGMSLPSFENDEQFNDVDVTDYDAEVVVEGIGESLKNAKTKIVEWFKKMIETIKNFFKSRWGAAARLQKRLDALKEKLKGSIDFTKAGDVELETYKFDDMMAALKLITNALTKLKNIKTEDPSSKFEQIDDINAGLLKVGIKISPEKEDGDTYTYKIETDADSKLEKTKDKLSALKWSVSGISSGLQTIKDAVKLAAEGDKITNALVKAQNAAVKAAETKANEAHDKAESVGADDTKPSLIKEKAVEEKTATATAATNLVNRAGVVIKSVTKLTDAVFNLAGVFCSIGEKLPKKK